MRRALWVDGDRGERGGSLEREKGGVELVERFEFIPEALRVGAGRDGFAFGVEVDREEREGLGVFHCAEGYCFDCGVPPARLCIESR